jgi:hypothetical protein
LTNSVRVVELEINAGKRVSRVSSLRFPFPVFPGNPGKLLFPFSGKIVRESQEFDFKSDFSYIVSISNIIVSNAMQLIYWVISLVPTTIWH